MKVIGKDRTSCDVCNPIDEIIARLDALERRASAIVAKVQGITPDGEGNVTLPTSSSDTDPLHGRVDAFAMSSEVKEAADDAHAYAATIADDVVVLQSDVEILTREVEALDPASVTALEQSVAALQQTVNQLSNLVGGFSAVIRDLEDQMPNKVDRTGDTMTGPLNVIDTVTGSRNTQAVNGNRLQDDLDNYAPMVRTTDNQMTIAGDKGFLNSLTALPRNIFNALGWTNIFDINNKNNVYVFIMVSASNFLLCQIGGYSAARVLVIGNKARPYPDVIKIAHNKVTNKYEIWFNALYGAWVRGYMISEGTGNSVGSPSSYSIKNNRGNEPIVGETYDSVVVSTRWDVVT